MLVWRLGTAAHPIWDGAGAARYGGRWNPPGMPAIYAASSLSLAMLERLVQQNNLARTSLVEAIVPDNIEVTDLMADPPANWRAWDSPEATRTGREWLARNGTALLRVPSAVVPREANHAINPAHPDAARIQVMPPDPLFWDARVFGAPAPA